MMYAAGRSLHSASLLLKKGAAVVSTTSTSTTARVDEWELLRSIPRRRSRQLEHAYGPAWRYVVPPRAGQRIVDAALSSKRSAVAKGGAIGGEGRVIPCTAAPASCSSGGGVEGLPGARDVPPNVKLVEDVWCRNAVDDLHPHPYGAGPHGDSFMRLLEQSGEGEGEVMLAMWTSLHRCCLHRSELTEALERRVRLVFHRLIRIRAFVSAAHLYRRLLDFGVHLRSSDVILLLANLPYERSTTHRSAEIPTLAERRPPRKRVGGKGRGRNDAPRHGRDGKEMVVGEQDLPPGSLQPRPRCSEAGTAMLASEISIATSDTVAENRSAGAYPTAVVPLSSPEAPAGVSGPLSLTAAALLDRRPEWIRRWVLYEASMGTIDLFDPTNVDPMLRPFTPEGLKGSEGHHGVVATMSSTAPAHPNPEGSDEAGWFFDMEATHYRGQLEEAQSAMEITALLQHLNLLQSEAGPKCDTVCYRAQDRSASHASLPSVQPAHGGATRKLQTTGVAAATWRRPPRNSKPCFWAEALSLAALYIKNHPSAVSRDAECPGRHGAAPLLRSTVSSEFCSAARQAVAASSSWKVSLQFIVGASSHTTINTGDAIDFMECASPHAPWARSRRVEDFVANFIAPRVSLAPSSAACYACVSIWSVHLSTVKQERPDDYLRLSPTESPLNLPQLLVKAVSSARLAASHLVIESHRFLCEQQKTNAMAASVRRGLFTEPTAPPASTSPSDGSAGHGRWPDIIGSEGVLTLMPEHIQQATRLVCAAVERVAELAPVLSVADQDVCAIPTFVADTIYGDFSLGRTFAFFYESSTHSARHIRRASERAAVAHDMSAALLRALYHLSQPRCTEPLASISGFVSSGTPGGRLREGTASPGGVAFIPVAQAVHVLQQAARLVEHAVHPHHGALPGGSEELVAATARLAKPFLALLGVSDRSESVVFGSASPDAALGVASYVQVMLWVGPDAVWGSLLPSCKRAIRLATNPSNSFGKAVRRELLSGQVSWLDEVIHSPFCARRARGAHRRTASGREQAVRMPRCASSDSNRPHKELCGAAAHRGLKALQKQLTMSGAQGILRQAEIDGTVASLIRQHYENRQPLESELLKLLVAAPTSWEYGLRLFHSVMRHWRIPRGTLSVQFFGEVISAIGSAGAGCGIVRMHHDQRGQEERVSPGVLVVPQGSPATPRVVSNRDMWLHAISVFWAAVDHTGKNPANCPEAPSTRGDPCRNHEKEVLRELILPLVRAAAACGRWDTARKWGRCWQSLYCAVEQDIWWTLTHIQVLTAVNDYSALDVSTRALRRFAECRHPARAEGADPLRELYRLQHRIAVRHVSWRDALAALQDSATSPGPGGFSCLTVAAMLRILHKCPTNLSMTAVKLYHRQGNNWNAQCSLELLSILLRARRWAQALEHMSDAVSRGLVNLLPSTGEGILQTGVAAQIASEAEEIGKSLGVSSDPQRVQAELLVRCLHACAIGARSDEAEVCYDAYKKVRHGAPDSSPTGENQQDQHRLPPFAEAVAAREAVVKIEVLLGSVLRDEPISDVAEEKAATMSALDSRARTLFLRAMTKTVVRAPKR